MFEIHSNLTISGAKDNVDGIIRRLDLCMTGGRLEPRNFQLISEAVNRIQSFNWDWQNERVRTAIYLIATTPEFCTQR